LKLATISMQSITEPLLITELIIVALSS